MAAPGRSQRSALISVHLSDLSYLADISRAKAHTPEAQAVLLKRSIRLLLLAFEAVYIQISQLIFQTEYQREVVERLVVDREFRRLIRSGLVRILHSKVDPRDSVGAQTERLNLVRWPFAEGIPGGAPEMILSAPVHADLNSVGQSRSALGYLADRIRWRRLELDPDRALSHALEAHADRHDGRLMSEHLLSELVRGEGSRSAVMAVAGIIQETYFQDTTVAGCEVVRYLPAIRPEDELGTAEPVVPYLYSPSFVQAYASAWLAPGQMAALARAEPAFFLRLREEGSWAPFRNFFHLVLVQTLSTAIRARFDATGVHSTTLADSPLGLNGALNDEIAGLLPMLDALPGTKLGRTLFERVFHSKQVARYAANVGYPEIGRFFGDVARMLDVFAAHGGREARVVRSAEKLIE